MYTGPVKSGSNPDPASRQGEHMLRYNDNKISHMQFICTEDSDADELWHSADTDSDEADDNYVYREEWVAGPDTRLEELPQAQPYGQYAALIPGFVRKVYKIRKSGMKKKQAQLAKLDHELNIAFTKK